MLQSVAEFVLQYSPQSSPQTFSSLVLVTAAIFCIVSVLLSLVRQRKLAVKSVDGVPGPDGHWLKGHLDYVSFKQAESGCGPYQYLCYLLWSNGNFKNGFFRSLLQQIMIFFFQEKWSSQQGGEVELFHHVSLMTLDSVLKCALSYRTNCQTQKKQDPYIVVVYEASGQILDRLMNPLIHNDTIYKLTPDGRRFFKNCAFVHAKADGIIKARRKALQDDEEKEKLRKKKHLDFLDILLEAKDENGSSLTDEEIVGEVVTFMFAGHDTTASVISWTLYNLARFPEHQEKCLEEIEEVFGNSSEIEWKQLGKLKYLLMCIKESCRLFAPVPIISRTLDRTYEIDGHLVPEGTWVMTNVYALHLNPHVWRDPKKFDPLRFTTENAKEMSPYAFIPFSAGPRNCIGQSFALTEVKLSLAMIIRKFKLSVNPDNYVPIEDMIPELILRAKNGIKVNIAPRA
ncbi:cytochrome P450 4F4-like [Pocillopora damicornis]|uniref:cytochrome P450 4F4-like n=1 Tax=Pocillopora damicornis TaxID=46731 RepID=UPI000F555524|nr:cytochrome P450 4F4-like [Pocillopora damicornis]